jgi:hypothetical protein
MASEAQKYTAGGTIRPSRIVKLNTSADFTVDEADANERAIGIAQTGLRDAPGLNGAGTDAAAAGEEVMVFHPGQVAPLEIGSGGCSAGDLLKSDADGKGVIVATTGQTRQWVSAIAEESGSDGDVISVRVMVFPYYPTVS